MRFLLPHKFSVFWIINKLPFFFWNLCCLRVTVSVWTSLQLKTKDLNSSARFPTSLVSTFCYNFFFWFLCVWFILWFDKINSAKSVTLLTLWFFFFRCQWRVEEQLFTEGWRRYQENQNRFSTHTIPKPHQQFQKSSFYFFSTLFSSPTMSLGEIIYTLMQREQRRDTQIECGEVKLTVMQLRLQMCITIGMLHVTVHCCA